MNMEKVLALFPSDLSPLIKSFIFRLDWKTCRKHESDLISFYNKWTKRVLSDDATDWFHPGIRLNFPIMFNQKELDVYLEDWTMFGRWWIILMTRKDSYWNQRRVIFYGPAPHSIEHTHWYRWEFFWYHNEHRRVLMR